MSFEREGACLRVRVLTEGESASSSPEASREEGCCSSTAEDLSRSEADVRFRFAEPVDDGEDMMRFEHELHQSSQQVDTVGIWLCVRRDKRVSWFERERRRFRMRSDHTSIAKEAIISNVTVEESNTRWEKYGYGRLK